jgi:type IV pilus assembly protein PilX
MHTLHRSGAAQRGSSLLIVMVVLIIVSLLGLAGIQVSMMAERSSRNDRDQQIAWQSAEAALIDAEFDLFGPVPSSRRTVFGPSPDMSKFEPDCGGASSSTGLCALVSTGKPAWLTVDLAAGSRAAEFGQFTGRDFAAGGPGIKPAAKPRYVMEPIRDPADRDLGSSSPKYIYRVTAMGFGPRPDIQAVVQMIYRL